MSNNQTAWQQAENYLAAGVSIIPVYDSGEQAKRPAIHAWKRYQSEIISKSDLYTAIETSGTHALAIIAGAVSGNLEVIDIDVKNWYGIDALLFQAIQTLYPELWARLRIHKSPSGGYHIIYRIENHAPGGNAKLCFKAETKGAAIETRGEGGYVLAPPAAGYSVFLENPIPVITWAERCSLFAICEGFSEKQQQAPRQATGSKAVDTMYSENPFEHYNGSAEGANVLAEMGWTFLKETTLFAYYERPNQTERNRIGASFNKEKHCFYIFTSSTALENDRGYNPATVLSILKYNGDHKDTFKYLIGAGFGRIKPEVEKRLIKKAAVNGRELPANISPAGATEHAILKAQLTDLHPYGLFWEIDEEGKVIIDRELLYTVAGNMGFKIDGRGDICLITDGIITRKTVRQFYDLLKDYIKEEEAYQYRAIVNSFDKFFEEHHKHVIRFLPVLSPDSTLTDTPKVCYKCFSNGVLIITAEGAELVPYEAISQLIWAEKIQPRNYEPRAEGKYSDFLRLATDYGPDVERAIGYLAHEYKDETTAYIVVLVEACENPEDGGGSGKNVFCNLLKHTTTLCNKPGAQVKYDEKFLQSWNFERVFCLSDVPKNFEFMFLKDMASNDAIIKKLFKDEATVAMAEMPKFLIQTNYSYEVSDGGLRRRIIPIEFTNFFTLCGGIDVHFGCHFPRGWADEDWNNYDTVIAAGVQKWLASGLKLSRRGLSEGGWIKQFRQTYGNTISDLIEELWETWCRMGEVSNEEWKRLIETWYNDNSIPKHYQPSSKKLAKAVAEWAKKEKVFVDFNKVISANTGRGKVFISENIPF